MFYGAESCTYLNLENNQISEIKPRSFVGLKNLTFLSLTNNPLKRLKCGAFDGLVVLKKLHLKLNWLTTLSADVFSPLPRPLELSVKYNHLTCDSDLCWLKQEKIQGTITFLSFFENPMCANGIDWDTWTCNVTGNPVFIPQANLQI